VKAATGIFEGSASLSESISHEVIEALVDPLCDLWTHMPGRPAGVLVAYEACDPVEDSYTVGYMDRDVQVSNFVYPSFFDDKLVDPQLAAKFMAAGGKFDHLGKLTRAGQIGPEGYAVFKDGSATWLENDAGRMGASPRPGASHPAARTNRRLSA